MFSSLTDKHTKKIISIQNFHTYFYTLTAIRHKHVCRRYFPGCRTIQIHASSIFSYCYETGILIIYYTIYKKNPMVNPPPLQPQPQGLQFCVHHVKKIYNVIHWNSNFTELVFCIHAINKYSRDLEFSNFGSC